MQDRVREEILNGEKKGPEQEDTVMNNTEKAALEEGPPVPGVDQDPEVEQTGEYGGAGQENEDRESLLNQLALEKNRAEDYFNRLARMQADFENYRRRVAKEKEDLLKYAGEQVIVSLLPVLDNLERALAVKHDDVEKVYEGVEMIGRQIRDILTAGGLEAIPAVGEQFNPEIHEAVMREEGSEHPENTIVEELRKGYTLKGKIIRAAMVKVAT
ncbi:MAG: nucleotide exchange factor GrpE [Bacillota bacterium]